MKKRLLSAIFLIIVLNIFAETKEASDVFGKWVHWQYAYKDRDIRTMHRTLVPSHEELFNTSCAGFEHLKDQASAMLDLSNSKSTGHWGRKRPLLKIYADLNSNIQGFVDHLKTHRFATDIVNNHEKEISIFTTIDKYKLFMRAFFNQQDEKVQNEYLFATANRFFEYCFDEKTFKNFNELLENQQWHPIARFLYSVMWYHLVGEGWKDWHQNCLDALKKEHDHGKRIVYIAGGNDMYQLIKHGIYNIDIIDPMLPSQPDYYAEGWLWLIKSNGLGDTITCDFDTKSVVMKRAGYKEYELFDAKLSTGDTVKIRHSKTTWHVCDGKSMKVLGTIIIDRRFARQADFLIKKNAQQVLLLSFNEMYFVDAPESFGGWGINTSVIRPETKIFVKQLRKPITKSTWTYLRKADAAPFSFILLGSSPT